MMALTRDVVVRRNHTKVEWRYVHLVLNSDTLRVDQVVEGVLDQLREMI